MTEAKRVPTIYWSGLEEHPVEATNVATIQTDGDATVFYLSFGFVSTPPSMNEGIVEPDEIRARTVARLALSKARLDELRELLNRVAGQADEIAAMLSREGTP